MSICPTCMTKYPDSVTTCTADGAGLVPEEAFAYVDKDLVAGDVVGEYRIEGKLGEGGFGAVFRAIHPVIGKHAAIKVLSRQFSANPQMVSRFIAEARAVNQIRHRNIIDIFAFGQLPDGRQYYVMELLDGVTFDAYLDSNKRLSLAQALPILRGVTRALDAAHAKGILHRDLKPENIYLVFDEDGGVQPKLLDFGLVKLLGQAGSGGEHHKTKTGTPMGTPYYMSPEQCRGKDVDRATDIYAFGALVFQVLTGAVPFNGDSPMDVLLQHMTKEPPRMSERCADVPAALDGPILRMLAKEPSDRPASVGEALEALVAAGTAAGVLTGGANLPPPSPPSNGANSFQSAATTPAMEGGDVLASVRVAAGDVSPNGNTFLASEADVAPPRSRARVGLMAAVAFGALVVGGVIMLRVMHEPKPLSGGIVAPPASSPAALAMTAPSVATSVSAPKSEDVEIRIEGAPKNALVSAGSRELGMVPGPFTMTKGVPVTLTVVAKDYQPQDVTVAPTSNATLIVLLKKQSAAIPKGGGVKGTTVSPELEGFDKK